MYKLPLDTLYKYIDYSKTKFTSAVLHENKYNTDDYNYNISFSVDIQYKNINTGDRSFDEFMNSKVVSYSGVYDKHYESRPEMLKNVILPQDDEEGTQDPALQDYFDHLVVSKQFEFIDSLFYKNILIIAFEKAASDGNVTLSDESKRKVSGIEFNYRKPEVNNVTVLYDNGESSTVSLPHTITNKDVDNIIPGGTLVRLYSHFEDWLDEDYESTVQIAKEIFKFDLETLKGAVIR